MTRGARAGWLLCWRIGQFLWSGVVRRPLALLSPHRYAAGRRVLRGLRAGGISARRTMMQTRRRWNAAIAAALPYRTWLLAAATGTVGMLLLLYLQISSLLASQSAAGAVAPEQIVATAAPLNDVTTRTPPAGTPEPLAWHDDRRDRPEADSFLVDEPPPRQFEMRPPPDLAGEPDPFAADPPVLPRDPLPSEEAGPLRLPAAPGREDAEGADPFSVQTVVPSVSLPRAGIPELTLDLVRLPTTVQRGPVEDDENEFFVTSSPAADLPGDRPGQMPHEAGDSAVAAGFARDDWNPFNASHLPPAFKLQLYEGPPPRDEFPRPSTSHEPGAAGSTASAQAVNLAITRVLPRMSVVYEPLSYDIVVRNEGDRAVEQVIVEEHLAGDHHLTGAEPAPALDDRTLRWQLRHLKPGQEERLTVRVVPTVTGAAESAATVRAFAAVGTSTEVQGAKLAFDVELPAQVPQGGACRIRYRVTNIGPAAATEVVIRNDLPEALSHRAGRELDYVVGTIAPGQTIVGQLTVRAETPGTAVNRAEVVAAGGVRQQVTGTVEVVRPGAPAVRGNPPPRTATPCPCPPYRFVAPVYLR